ncbi:MAG: Flavodoxin [Brockia lithotrophica]|uniref:Flavodoxin n=1 Tax=Brockia lithotrophica TaxID=933949 RepID=A0A2T5G748_9BACL|nr:MAG: Flavodoxin [Brockia lithotrophica]
MKREVFPGGGTPAKGDGAPAKALVSYVSYSGNTRETAEIVAEVLSEKGFDVTLLDVSEATPPGELGGFDVYAFGALTWGDGELPEEMRVFLRGLLPLLEERAEEGRAPKASVFGTGDSIFPRFCWAVDIMFYHLTKREIPTFPEKLKIEQSPYGLGQVAKVKTWAEKLAEWAQSPFATESATHAGSVSKFAVK